MNIPFIHNNSELQKACEYGIETCIEQNTIPFNFNFGLYGACLSGNEYLINVMIDLGANDFEWALRGISQNGNIELIKYIEEKLIASKNNCTINYSWALAGACTGNNIDAVNYYLSKYDSSSFNVDAAFRITCEKGYLEIFNVFMDKLENKLNYTLGMAGACYGFRHNKKYPESIFDQLLCKLNKASLLDNPNTTYFDCILYEAAFSGLQSIIEFIIEKQEILKINLIHVIRGAVLGGHTDLIMQCVLQNKSEKEKYVQIGYYEAAYSGNTNIIKWFEEEFVLPCDMKLYYLTGLCQSGRKPTEFDLLRINNSEICLWCWKDIHWLCFT